MLLQGQVGPQQLGAGVQANLALGKAGEALVSEFHGRFYSLCYANKVFSESNQAAKALTTLSTTYTGNLLYNPVGSGFNLIVLQCLIAIATAPAGISNIHHEGTQLVQTAALSGLTANTVINNNFGNAASVVGVGLGYNVATLTLTPTIVRAIGGGPNATGSVTTPFINDEINGAIILGPGTFMGLGYLTTAVSVVATYTWAELPL